MTIIKTIKRIEKADRIPRLDDVAEGLFEVLDSPSEKAADHLFRTFLAWKRGNRRTYESLDRIPALNKIFTAIEEASQTAGIWDEE